MLGPAADEVAEMWRDQVRVYRYGRQLKLLEKVEKMAQEAGFTPQAVPPKILFPLLEGASFEEDEDLHTMWAALLANAASTENVVKVRPGFIRKETQIVTLAAAPCLWHMQMPHFYDLVLKAVGRCDPFCQRLLDTPFLDRLSRKIAFIRDHMAR